MVSNDVSKLAAGPSNSGCYAVLLTPQGRIVADLQVLSRPDAFWLDLEHGATDAVVERLTKYIIADDVELDVRGDELERMALEGPKTPEILVRAIDEGLDPSPDSCADVSIAGVPVTVASFGWSGESALQFFVASESAGAVADALRAAGAELDLVDASADALEILRIEAGNPRTLFDLDETVLPAEAGLERAISTTKGCYTGQEVVERLRSQGKASHLLVGLESGESDAFEVGAAVEREGKRVGEVTSACVSPEAGPIALAYVRRAFTEKGTEVVVVGRSARVVGLPFVGPGSAG